MVGKSAGAPDLRLQIRCFPFKLKNVSDRRPKKVEI
jgi:hypothetical protein